MGTPRSASEGGWTASALIYSGRPAPKWPLAAADARRLVDLWNALRATTLASPEPSALGYGGCMLDDGAGTVWRVQGGIAVARSGANVEARTDGARGFERAILSTAPGGLLPSGIIALAIGA